MLSVYEIAPVRPTDWLTILPSILLSKYKIQHEADRAACHVVYTLSCIPDVAAIDSLTGWHAFSKWIISPAASTSLRERERTSEREKGRDKRKELEKSIGVWRVPTPASKENIVADTAKPPPIPGHPLTEEGKARVEMSALLRRLKRLRIV